MPLFDAMTKRFAFRIGLPAILILLGGSIPMAEHVAAEFAVSTGIKIKVIPGLGSKGAIAATIDGVIDLAISARPLNAEEATLGLTASPFARTALVFITSKDKPNSLKSTELVELFKLANPNVKNCRNSRDQPEDAKLSFFLGPNECQFSRRSGPFRAPLEPGAIGFGGGRAQGS